MHASGNSTHSTPTSRLSRAHAHARAAAPWPPPAVLCAPGAAEAAGHPATSGRHCHDRGGGDQDCRVAGVPRHGAHAVHAVRAVHALHALCVLYALCVLCTLWVLCALCALCMVRSRPFLHFPPPALKRALSCEQLSACRGLAKREADSPARLRTLPFKMLLYPSKGCAPPGAQVRPSYVLGGRAMEIVYSSKDISRYIQTAGALRCAVLCCAMLRCSVPCRFARLCHAGCAALCCQPLAAGRPGRPRPGALLPARTQPPLPLAPSPSGTQDHLVLAFCTIPVP